MFSLGLGTCLGGAGLVSLTTDPRLHDVDIRMPRQPIPPESELRFPSRGIYHLWLVATPKGGFSQYVFCEPL